MSGQLLAEAPTGSGHDLRGRGNEMKNSGRVNSDNRGTDIAEASTIMARINGNNINDMIIVGIVDPRRCFLSVHELMSSVKKKYVLLRNWTNLSLHSPVIIASIGTPRVVTVVLVVPVTMTM